MPKEIYIRDESSWVEVLECTVDTTQIGDLGRYLYPSTVVDGRKSLRNVEALSLPSKADLDRLNT